MSTIPIADLVQEISYLLTETFESPIKDGNAYLDKGTGIFMTLSTISAEDALETRLSRLDYLGRSN